MRFDRIDICEAHYLFLSFWHEGQFSKKYRRLCRMTRYFSPRPSLRPSTLTPNGKAIYSRLVGDERHKERRTTKQR